jgi:small membrane protein
MIIQAVLIIFLVLILVYGIQRRNTIQLKAWKKMLLIGFVLVSVVSILDPNVLNTIAHWVGVGRGADLLLYLLIVAFVFVTINIYLKFKDYDEKVVKLSRQIALYEAELAESVKKPKR